MLGLSRTPKGIVLLPLLPLFVGACTDEGQEREAMAQEALAKVEFDYSDSDLDREEKWAAFAPVYDSVAREHWGTRGGLEALFTHLYYSTYSMEDEEKAPVLASALNSIFAEYGKSKHIALLTDWIYLFDDEEEEGLLARLLEESPHDEVKAAAIFEPTNTKMGLLRYGRIEDTTAVEAEIEENLQLLLNEYGDTPKGGSTYGALAEAILNAHSESELAIGQPAPEVVGQTVDGEEILLSQFKGKVTVFYFWGDW